ncbi:hypothetical protein V502_03291 [Pseudogymnoascus sp. VKM F-4520 (FW-2644)]|nr:hypothetical protein V502_03291 [Pseudogymnoascus sp. VKM F-4520 (FW-2644)]
MSHQSSDDDDDLNKAIALSLQDSEQLSSPAPKQPVVIDLISDDDTDTDDLDQPAVLDKLPPGSGQKDPAVSNSKIKLEESLVIRPQVQNSETKHANSQAAAKPVNQSGLSQPFDVKEPTAIMSGLGGLDRRKMEEERLARAEKRKAISSQPENSDVAEPPLKKAMLGSGLKSSGMSDRRPTDKPVSRNTAKSYDTKVALHPMRVKTTTEFLIPSQLMKSEPAMLADIERFTPGPDDTRRLEGTNRTKMPDVQLSKDQQARIARGIQYPHGVVKQTWAFGFPRSGDIKIEEVLQKTDLDLAVLSSFQWDQEWILSKLNMARTKLILVAQAVRGDEQEEVRKSAPNNVRFCFPSNKDGTVSTMHSKLQLLAHPSHLRVVVPSANLVPYDWGETGIMENTVFLIDLPRLADNRIVAVESLTPFGRELRRFLHALGLDAKITDSLLKFDFSQTADLAFVYSIGGNHTESDWKTIGYPGLGSAIQELGLANSGPLNVAFVSASIGALMDDFMLAILLACKGDDGLKELTWRTSAPPANRKRTPEEKTLLMEMEEGFRIMFPSHETVQKSIRGTSSGGTICLDPKYYQRDQFPKELFRDCKSKRAGLLLHSKLLFTAPTQAVGGRGGAWAYVGSANLSESAWGRLTKNKSTKQVKLYCRNWECGVVIPVNRSTASQNIDTPASTPPQQTAQDHDIDINSIFEGVVPVPMDFPGVEYGQGRPWFRNEQ